MNAQAHDCFGHGRSIEFNVPFAADAEAQRPARKTLKQTCDAFGCVPTRPTGSLPR